MLTGRGIWNKCLNCCTPHFLPVGRSNQTLASLKSWKQPDALAGGKALVREINVNKGFGNRNRGLATEVGSYFSPLHCKHSRARHMLRAAASREQQPRGIVWENIIMIKYYETIIDEWIFYQRIQISEYYMYIACWKQLYQCCDKQGCFLVG